MTLLIKKHYPGNVEYAGVVGPPWSWDHFVAAESDTPGISVARQIKNEFWVSLHSQHLSILRIRFTLLELMK